MKIFETATASSKVPIANCDPPLNPNQPSHKINTPIVTKGIEDAAKGFTGEGAPDFAPSQWLHSAESHESYLEPSITFNNLYED